MRFVCIKTFMSGFIGRIFFRNQFIRTQSSGKLAMYILEKRIALEHKLMIKIIPMHYWWQLAGGVPYIQVCGTLCESCRNRVAPNYHPDFCKKEGVNRHIHANKQFRIQTTAYLLYFIALLLEVDSH